MLFDLPNRKHKLEKWPSWRSQGAGHGSDSQAGAAPAAQSEEIQMASPKGTGASLALYKQ